MFLAVEVDAVRLPSKKPFYVYFRVLHAYTIIYLKYRVYCSSTTPQVGHDRLHVLVLGCVDLSTILCVTTVIDLQMYYSCSRIHDHVRMHLEYAYNRPGAGIKDSRSEGGSENRIIGLIVNMGVRDVHLRAFPDDVRPPSERSQRPATAPGG